MKKKIRDNLGTVAIICFSLSVIIFSINLFGRIGSSILTTNGKITFSEARRLFSPEALPFP